MLTPSKVIGLIRSYFGLAPSAAGTLTLGTTTISEAELGVLDGVTPGTAAASKALVLDANLDLSGFKDLFFLGDGYTLNWDAVGLYRIYFNANVFIIDVNGTARLSLSTTAATFGEAVNLVLGTTTGSKIGTATSQKIGFWNATPVVQPTAVADASGGATVDTEARAALNALLARLRTIGIIAT